MPPAKQNKIKRCFIKLCYYLSCIDTIHTPKMYDFHWSNATYMNPSRATIPLIRPHQCDSDGGRIRGVLLYYKITEYGIQCCMHAHLEAPRAPPSRGELYRCKTLFLDNFPIFFLSKWDLDPPTHFQIIFGFLEFF